MGSPYAVAFAAFRKTFKEQVGYGWEDRNRLKVKRWAAALAKEKYEMAIKTAETELKAMTEEELIAWKLKLEPFTYTALPRECPQGEMEQDLVDEEW